MKRKCALYSKGLWRFTSFQTSKDAATQLPMHVSLVVEDQTSELKHLTICNFMSTL